MKSTTYSPVGISTGIHTGAKNIASQDKWRAIPFLVLMFSAGLPLTYQLEVARTLTVADSAELTMAATASQNTANSMFFVLFICSLYIFAGWTLLRKPKTVTVLLSRQWPIFFLTLLIAASAFWSHAPEKVMINIIHNVGTTLITIAAALRYRNSPWLFPKHVGYVVGANMVLHMMAVALIPAYAIDWQGRWHGLAPHANTLGALAFVVLWSNASILIFTKNDRYHLHLFFSGLAILAMYGANSMTTMSCSVFVLLLMFTFYKMKKLSFQQRVCFFILGMCLLIPLATALISNIINLEHILNAFGRDTKLTGRVSLWEDAVKAISEHPFFGWSFDDHVYLVRVSNMAFPNFHNGILDLAVNGGLIAVMLFILILIIITVDYFKPSKIGASIAPFSASFMLTFLVYSITEANLVSPRAQMWEIFLALAFLGTCKNWSKPVFPNGPSQKMGPSIKPLPTVTPIMAKI
ncbi:MAG: O-antigen ligase family protein [Undibacterium sp.]|nr:O-antigen ligase family protein [Undibacterium sp.]